MSTALVLGGAACVWEDVEAALELGEYQGVVACNDAAAHWPGELDAAVSLHMQVFPRWLTIRKRKGYPKPKQVLGHLEASKARVGPGFVTGFTEYKLPGQDRSGTSGLFAVKVALVDLGFDKAVLCGIPMDEQAHFFGGGPWRGGGESWKAWLKAYPFLKDRARSMSGRTSYMLGTPEPDWISRDGASASP